MDLAKKILDASASIRHQNKDIRYGQSVYIAAYRIYPKQVNQITQVHEELDCFNFDVRVAGFLKKLKELVDEA